MQDIRRRGPVRISLTLAALLTAAMPAAAAEFPAGEVMERDGIALKAVYLQAVVMAPAMPGQEPGASDIHLEADVSALAGNPYGLPADAWVPYLDIAYRLTKQGSDWTAAGKLHPMVANDGPHYGANVKLDGPGAYDVTFTVEPPSANGFLRHTDKETGVGAWWTPFEYRGGFKFIGTGKKGGY